MEHSATFSLIRDEACFQKDRRKQYTNRWSRDSYEYITESNIKWPEWMRMSDAVEFTQLSRETLRELIRLPMMKKSFLDKDNGLIFNTAELAEIKKQMVMICQYSQLSDKVKKMECDLLTGRLGDRSIRI